MSRILTTHAGSLPRSAELVEALLAPEADRDDARLRELVARDMVEVLRRQHEVGLDVVNDGELPRAAFHLAVPSRMTGFAGQGERGLMADAVNFPQWSELLASRMQAAANGLDVAEIWRTPACTGEVRYEDDRHGITLELDQFAAALSAAGVGFAGTFLTAPSPGIVSTAMPRVAGHPIYGSDEEYVFALAAELKKEYDSIIAAGHVLQLDAPDLGIERALMFRDQPLQAFLDRVELHVRALNLALADVDPDRVRLHVCFGPYDGPHTEDPQLDEILPQLYEARVGALLLSFANPRHQHDYRALLRCPPPRGLSVVAGVVDVTTNFIEHREVVADRIERVAEAIGDPSRLIAGTECGFGTTAGVSVVAPDVAWEKLRSLCNGANLASERLF